MVSVLRACWILASYTDLLDCRLQLQSAGGETGLCERLSSSFGYITVLEVLPLERVE